MKWLNFILILIMFATMVFADDGLIETYRPNQVFSLPVHLKDSSGDINGANCSIQIRNESYGIQLEDVMKEIGGGYYNYTYNTSKVGKYFCRQNCTMGTKYGATTCDFIIEEDENLNITIIIALGILITFLFVLSRYVQVQAFKYLLIAIAVFVMLITFNIAMLMAKDNLSSSIYSLLVTTYTIVLYGLEFVMGIGVLFIMLYYAAQWLPDKIKLRRRN